MKIIPLVIVPIVAILIVVGAGYYRTTAESPIKAETRPVIVDILHDDMAIAAGSRAGVMLDGLPDYAEAGVMALGIANNGDYAPLQMDKVGRLLFECRDCPNKMCKRLACIFSMQKTGTMSADCECA